MAYREVKGVPGAEAVSACEMHVTKECAQNTGSRVHRAEGRVQETDQGAQNSSGSNKAAQHGQERKQSSMLLTVIG